MSGPSTLLPNRGLAAPSLAPGEQPVLRTLRQWVSADSMHLVLALSLLLLILCSDKSPWMMALGGGACLLALWQPQLCRSPWFWLVLASGQALRNVAAWITLDDHIYVANYWSLAVALALMTSDPRHVLRQNARWLIGLIFLFATFWKASSAEYVTGAFFEYCLLLDDRFLSLSQAVGGMDADQLGANYRNMAAVRDGAQPLSHFMLNSNLRVHLLAQLLTYWTLLIEGALAVVFLCSPARWLSRIRNPLLVVFALTTYFPVPVMGFCATLMVLGVAQTSLPERKARVGFLVVLALILAWTPLWRHLIYGGG